MPTIETTSATVYYDVRGEGKPLVLISALGTSSAVWEPFVPTFIEAGHQVITIDNRGTGRTGFDGSSFTIDDMADDVAAIIEEIGVGQCDAVGWSMGGSILQSLLIRHGKLVDRAVLLATFPNYSEIQHQWLDGELAVRKEADPLVVSVSGMPWLFTPKMLSDHQALIEVARAMLADPLPTSNEAYAVQAATLREYDSTSGLPGVQNRVLVLVGAEDVLTPTSQSVEMAQLIPNAELKILPRGGHAIPLEYPAETIDAIEQFLAG